MFLKQDLPKNPGPQLHGGSSSRLTSATPAQQGVERVGCAWQDLGRFKRSPLILQAQEGPTRYGARRSTWGAEGSLAILAASWRLSASARQVQRPSSPVMRDWNASSTCPSTFSTTPAPHACRVSILAIGCAHA